jgi:hypothetical protein
VIGVGNYVIGVGNYVIVSPSELGNYVSAGSYALMSRERDSGSSYQSWRGDDRWDSGTRLFSAA